MVVGWLLIICTRPRRLLLVVVRLLRLRDVVRRPLLRRCWTVLLSRRVDRARRSRWKSRWSLLHTLPWLTLARALIVLHAPRRGIILSLACTKLRLCSIRARLIRIWRMVCESLGIDRGDWRLRRGLMRVSILLLLGRLMLREPRVSPSAGATRRSLPWWWCVA
jgi:hypothetical protein